MSVDYCLVTDKEDIKKQTACWIGEEYLDPARIMLAFEWTKITDEFIQKIERVLNAVGTCEEYEITNILNWLKKNKDKEYFIETD